jgi:predicted Fe-Mo cluster-binding NifX family protein
MTYKIAIASSDGQKVDQHFGQAINFLIYEVSTGVINFIEDRDVNKCIDVDSNPETRISQIIHLLSDCKIVFASKIGERVVRELYDNGIKSFAVHFTLNEIFNTIIKRQNSRVRII